MTKSSDQIEKMLKDNGAMGGLQAFLMQLQGQGSKGSQGQFTLDFLNKGLQGFEDESGKALTGAKTNWAAFSRVSINGPEVHAERSDLTRSKDFRAAGADCLPLLDRCSVSAAALEWLRTSEV